MPININAVAELHNYLVETLKDKGLAGRYSNYIGQHQNSELVRDNIGPIIDLFRANGLNPRVRTIFGDRYRVSSSLGQFMNLSMTPFCTVDFIPLRKAVNVKHASIVFFIGNRNDDFYVSLNVKVNDILVNNPQDRPNNITDENREEIRTFIQGVRERLGNSIAQMADHVPMNINTQSYVLASVCDFKWDYNNPKYNIAMLQELENVYTAYCNWQLQIAAPTPNPIINPINTRPTMPIDTITDKLKNLLLESQNLILTGAPGTGKTFLAKEIATRIVAEDMSYANFDEWDDADKENFDDHVKFVQFHPSYDYTDFVEGLRPIKTAQSEEAPGSGVIGFDRQDGIFKEFCKRAVDNMEEKFIFIIDEINRGDLNKILGELFYSIEPSYRGERGKVSTQYQNMIEDDDTFKNGFYIPENVYIIGTMNDVDRSVESMDFAIRRRFSWYEVMAGENLGMLNSLKDYDEDIYNRAIVKMQSINEMIAEDEDLELGTAYQIGGAYFSHLEKYLIKHNNDEEQAYHDLWEYHLKGLLQEYIRGQEDIKGKMENLKAVIVP